MRKGGRDEGAEMAQPIGSLCSQQCQTCWDKIQAEPLPALGPQGKHRGSLTSVFLIYNKGVITIASTLVGFVCVCVVKYI